MKLLNKLKPFQSISFVFITLAVLLCEFCQSQLYAKTDILIDEANCTITMTVHKQFYVKEPQLIQRSIDTINRKREELNRAITETGRQVQQLQDAYAQTMGGGSGREEADLGGGGDEREQAAQQRLTQARNRLTQQREDLAWYDNKLREYQQALVEDQANRPGVSEDDIRNKLADWKRQFENMWNGTTPYNYHCCTVKFVYDYIFSQGTDQKRRGYDSIAIYLSRHFRSWISGLGRGDSDKFSSGPFEHDLAGAFRFWPRENYTIPHEGGHEMGHGDWYVEVRRPDGTIESHAIAGHENDLMGEIGGTPVSVGNDGTRVDNIAMILNKLHKTCPEPCCPGPQLTPRQPQPQPGQQPGPIGPPSLTTPRQPRPEQSRQPQPQPQPGQQPQPQPQEDQPRRLHLAEPVEEPPPTTPDNNAPTGPIVLVDPQDGNTTAQVYDPYGTPIDYVDRGKAQTDPDSLSNALKEAKKSGQGQTPKSLPKEGITKFPKGKDSRIIVLGKDVSDKEIDDFSEQLIGNLIKSGDFRKTSDSAAGGPGVDFSEGMMGRSVQDEESEINPNDPFYLDLVAYKKKKTRKQDLFSVLSTVKQGDGAVTGGLYTEKGTKVINDQWGLVATGFTPRNDPDSAWNLVDGDKKNVVVAIIDTGLDLTHPDGPQYLWVNPEEIPDNGKDDDMDGYIDDVHGWNFLENNNDLTDYKGHGTFIAGIVAARTNNALAIAGINPGARIMVLKVGNAKGEATNFDIYRALCYAANKGARIINISLGDKGISKLEQHGIDYAYNRGCLIVVAAGNQSANLAEYGPSAARRIITVAAADPQGKRMWFSNIGANVGLTAPGKNIFSLYSRDSEWKGPSYEKQNLCYAADGTSFAAPFVTGTASLLLAKNPELNNREIEDILLDTARDLEEEGWDQYTGAGFLNASGALSGVENKQTLTVRFMDIVINKDKKGWVTSVDLFGVIRGDLAQYRAELAKGKKSGGWRKIFESTSPTDETGFICRIDGKKVANGKEWSVCIVAQDKKGKIKTATMWFAFEK